MRDSFLAQRVTAGSDPRLLIKCNVDQFYGIEIEEFPAQIAQLALWLVDHQINLRVSEKYGNRFERLPLQKSATIVYGSQHGNALRIDWNHVVPAGELDYILGNPPFVGSKLMSPEQRSDLLAVAAGLKGAGVLDLVAAWYLKAAAYIPIGSQVRCAFVSTNSITQGEQVSVLWGPLLAAGFHIQFAHRTFRWNNEARGNAAVHCVIVGFGRHRVEKHRLFDYATLTAEPEEAVVARINPYLVEADNVLLPNRSSPLCAVPVIGIGNKPIDGGYYLFTSEERHAFLADEPGAAPHFRKWVGATEFLNGIERWCLWLGDVPPSVLRSLPNSREVVRAVKEYREGKRRPKHADPEKDLRPMGTSALGLADRPTRFHVERFSDGPQLVIPSVSSERRTYIPIGFEPGSTLCSNLVLVGTDVELYHLGVLNSAMHMAWVRGVCGRLKSDYRYSVGIVYNNFPWPELADAKHRAAIETAAQGVLDARAQFPGSTLADLYDPLSMPPVLVKAHQALDRTVDAAYVAAEKAADRKPPNLSTDAERVAFLFERYQALTSLLPAARPRPTRKRQNA